MTYNCICVGDKQIIGRNGKEYTVLWVALYNDDADFVDGIKLFSNKSLKGVVPGVSFTAKKGFNQKTRETFLYDIVFPDTGITT